MTSRARGLRPLPLSFVAVALLLGGCDLAAGLQDVGSSLTNPDAALLDHPGRKLADGLFRQLLIDGSLDEGGHVIALRENEDGQQLAIIPYLENDSCFLKPAVAVDRLSSRVDVELPGILSVQRTQDENGRGDISFVNFNCEDAFEGFTGSRLPQLAFPASKPRGLLGMTGAGELYLVEPGNKRTVYISTGATQASSSDDKLWTLEDGQLVIRDDELKVLDRMGSGVELYTLTAGSWLTVAFMDEDGLSFWNEVEGVTHISSSACNPTSWGSDTLAYFDPCEERKLNLYTRGTRIGVDADYVRLVGPKGIRDLDQHIATDWGSGITTSHLSFIAGESEVPSGDLLLASIQPGVELQDDELTIELETQVLAKGNANIRSGNIILNWNGVAGDLVEYETEDDEIVDLIPVADAVAQLPGGNTYSPRGVLSHFDGTTGDLRVYSRKVTKDGTTITSELIAKGVPIQPQTVEPDTGRMAFVGDSSDGQTGTLYLGRNAGEDPTRLQALEDHVLLNTARFLDQPRGLAYLVRAKGTTEARLRVWLIDSEIKLTVHKNVHEYRTVPWPAAGILYAVPNGDDQGLWFSKAR